MATFVMNRGMTPLDVQFPLDEMTGALALFLQTSPDFQMSAARLAIIGNSNDRGVLTGSDLRYGITDGDLSVTGGTFTGLNIISGSTTLVKATGLNLSAPDAWAALNSGNAQIWLELLMAGNDSITGTAGEDLINGRKGADTIIAGGGDDLLQGDVGNDKLVAGAGEDFVSADLGRDKAYGGGGGDALVGGNGNDSLFGGGGDDLLVGDPGADRMSGGRGIDSIYGNGGNDTLTGGGGVDYFLFEISDGTGGKDRITDFVHGTDKIVLDQAAFVAAGVPGVLANAAFRRSAGAQDADDRVLYDRATGIIWFDADGNGAGAKVRVVQMQTGLNLTASDFLIGDATIAF